METQSGNNAASDVSPVRFVDKLRREKHMVAIIAAFWFVWIVFILPTTLSGTPGMGGLQLAMILIGVVYVIVFGAVFFSLYSPYIWAKAICLVLVCFNVLMGIAALVAGSSTGPAQVIVQLAAAIWLASIFYRDIQQLKAYRASLQQSRDQQ